MWCARARERIIALNGGRNVVMVALGKRLQIIFVTALVISLGIPVWWHTTAVHRAPLPVEDIYLWNSNQKWPLFKKLFDEYPPGFPEKVAKASPGYRISFTLANDDPGTIKPTWDFSVIENYLAPLLENLSVIADFSIDSQIYHYTTLLQTAKHDSKSSTYYIPEDQVSHYINPHEWKPDYSSTVLPSLNFIIYIPNRATTPLKIRHPKGSFSATNSVLIPQWGSITFYNHKDVTNGNLSQNINLGCNELQEVLPIIAAQLNELLGAPFAAKLSNKDFNALVKLHLSENIYTSASTLLSLSKLIDSLPNMVVLDHISELVQGSVEQLNKAHDWLEKGDYHSSILASREALRTSELAFFDPSMLALLYFPDEHKYAIYTPLFLPVGFPIVAALVQEIKHRKAKKAKAEKEKKEQEERERKEREEREQKEREDNDANEEEEAENQNHDSDE